MVPGPVGVPGHSVQGFVEEDILSPQGSVTLLPHSSAGKIVLVPTKRGCHAMYLHVLVSALLQTDLFAGGTSRIVPASFLISGWELGSLDPMGKM